MNGIVYNNHKDSIKRNLKITKGQCKTYVEKIIFIQSLQWDVNTLTYYQEYRELYTQKIRYEVTSINFFDWLIYRRLTKLTLYL